MRIYSKEEYLKIKDLECSFDPYVAAWAADRLNEISQANHAKTNKESSKSKTTQTMEA